MLLLTAFSFTLIGPAAFAPRGDRTLHACCRTNGKHHCTLATGHDNPQSPAFQTGRCPWFGVQQTMPPVRAEAVIRPSQAIFAAIVSHPTARPQVEAMGRLSWDRSSQKR